MIYNSSGSVDRSLLGLGVGVSVLIILVLVFSGLLIDQQRMMQIARHSERKFITLFDYSPDMVVCYDPDKRRFINSNPSFERMTGYSREALRWQDSSFMLKNEQENNKMLRCFEEVSKGIPQKEDFVILHRRGHEIDIQTTMFPLFLADKLYIYMISKNITEQKKAEHALVQAKETAEGALQIKSEFLSMMSHEIRTPLNGIMGINQLLLESELDESQKSLLDLQEKSGNTLLNVINDILDFSTMDAGQISLSEEAFLVQPMIEECFDLFAIIARDKELDMTFKLDDRLPGKLIGDPLRLSQILNNLIGNAVKFTDSGSVKLVVRPYERSEEGVLSVEFIVSDTGIGISSDKYEEMFQPFTQLDSSLNRTYEGTGLGLAICKRLTELMNGEIWAENNRESGATFICRVPFKLVEESSGQAI